jgi:hypothetical protein
MTARVARVCQLREVTKSEQRDREIISADFLAGATLGRFLQFQLRRDTQDQISPT